MQAEHYFDPNQFAPIAERFLICREAENNLMFGLFQHLKAGQREGSGDPALYVIRDSLGDVVGAALWAGFHLILTRATPESHATLAEYLAFHQLHYPMTSGPASDVLAFAAAYSNRTGRPHALGPVMRLMQTREIQPPPIQVHGFPRLAGIDDIAIALEWSSAFTKELKLETGDRSERVQKNIQSGGILLWCDPEPVSMAIIVGHSANGARIGSVYTPPALRRRGYASACVAALGGQLLDSGCTFVFLYTDAQNKTSNHIYESIGFEWVCDWQQIDLNPATS